MIYLVLSVFSSSFIFVLFKLFPRFGIDTFQAIVFNYFTAFFLGICLYGNEWKSEFLYTRHWPYFAICCALLFISLFILMGISSQKNGVSSTSIAVKMSMAIALIIIIIAYKESLSVLKITGILFAFTGVFLVTYEKQKKESSFLWMLIVLFLGSGLLDFLLNYVQKYELNHLTPSLFSAIGFGIAGFIGLLILSVLFVKKQQRFTPRNVVAGIVLGIPNYFSIYLLIVSYQSTGWNDSTVLAVNNVLVVIVAALAGFTVFKEKVNKRKILGLITAIGAIILLFIAGK